MMVRLDLAAALLPDFDTWLREASPAALRRAFRRFTAAPGRAEIPEPCVYEIVERLEAAGPGPEALQWRVCA